MKNVGTGSLASAFTLLNADIDLGKQLIKSTLSAAKNRLNIEFLLSEKAIQNGIDAKVEITILKTWHKWYFDTLNTINDVEPTNNDELKSLIIDSQKQLKEFSDNLLSKLKN